MSKIEFTLGEIRDAVISMLQPIVLQGALPAYIKTDRGVETFHNKDDATKLLFHFVSRDRLEVEFVFECMQFAAEGPAYLQQTLKNLTEKLALAKQRRYEDNLLDISRAVVKSQPVADAVSAVLN